MSDDDVIMIFKVWSKHDFQSMALDMSETRGSIHSIPDLEKGVEGGVREAEESSSASEKVIHINTRQGHIL